MSIAKKISRSLKKTSTPEKSPIVPTSSARTLQTISDLEKSGNHISLKIRNSPHEVKVTNNEDAIDFLERLAHIDMSGAMYTSRLLGDRSAFAKYVKHETQELSNLTNGKTIPQVVQNTKLRQRIYEYYDLFLRIEDLFADRQDLPGKGQFGKILCKKLLTKISVSREFAQEFLGVVNLKNRQRFEHFVTTHLNEAVTNQTEDLGLKDVLATTSDNILSPTNSSLIDTFLHAINKIETSRRYEILARVDAYIRSGWARHDFEKDPPSELKKAMEELKIRKETTGPDSLQTRQALAKASSELFYRFDEVFRIVKVNAGKAVDYGVFSIQEGYQRVGNPKSLDTASTGLIDVAITDQKNPKKWYFSLVTSTLSAEHLDVESNQLFRHREAVRNIVFQNGDVLQPIQVDQIDFSVVYPSMINTSNGINAKNKFAQQMGITKSGDPMEQYLNALVPLTLMSNTNDLKNTKDLRLLAVGNKQAPIFQFSCTDDEHIEYASNAMKEVIPTVIQALKSQSNVPLRSKLSTVIQMCTKIMNQFAKEPAFLQDVDVNTWADEFEEISASMDGSISDVRTIEMTCAGISRNRSKRQAVLSVDMS